MGYRASSGPSHQYGNITDVQPGGLVAYAEGLSLLDKAPFVLTKAQYLDFAAEGMTALRVNTLVTLLRQAGRVTVTETPVGRKIERR